MPPLSDCGVPASVALPEPPSTSVTPTGNEPLPVIEGVGSPVAVTSKLPGRPVSNVALGPLVMLGALVGGVVAGAPSWFGVSASAELAVSAAMSNDAITGTANAVPATSR